MDEKKAIISNKQFRDILICIAWPATINYGSGILAREVGRDMWMSGIIGVLTTLPIILITIYIGRSFPGKTIVEYSISLLGSFFGKLIGLLITVYFFVVASSSVSMYVHHLTDFLLPETPFIVVTVLHVLVVTYFVWKGTEAIARTSVIAFAMAVIFYILVFLASLAEIDVDRILPFFDSGVIPVFKASLKAYSFVGVIPMLIMMILPNVSDQKKAFGSAASGLAIGGFFFVLYFVVELMVMGPDVVALMRIASMDFVRSIQITQYLHRFESFMVGLWYWSILVHAGILTSCSLEAFMQTTGIKKKTPGLVITFGIMMVILTYFIAHDRIFFLNLREYGWQYFSLPIQFGIPLLFLVVLGIKKMFSPSKN